MIRRPKPGETEEDLLRQQREFLKGSGDDSHFGRPEGRIKSKNRFEILRDVVERREPLPTEITDSIRQETEGFPKTFVIDPSLAKKSKGKKKKSLFSMQMAEYRQTPREEEDIVEAENFSSASLSAAIPEPDNISFNALSTNQEEASRSNLEAFDPISESFKGIHNENLEKLSKMSEEEILEEKKKLLETLDPNVVEFLTNRKRDCLGRKEPKNAENCEPDDEEVKKKLEKYLDSKWLNMDFLEKEKLEWIGDLPDKRALEPFQPYTARFDFKGDLQPFDDDIDVRNALYHHGDEPNRPGYTIEELYQLSRSTVLQQRILALDTLANIIRKTKLGYYDRCFDGQLLHKLVESDLFFLLRFSIDEKSLVSASINCLYSLLCNESDEFCLDKLLGVTNVDEQPYLLNKMETKKEEEIELNDHVLIGCDMIKGVLRTDLLIRMAYVLSNFPQNREIDIRAINCLIRIARHSPEATFGILNTGNLLDVVYYNLKTKKPAYQGVKLLRIMSTQSKAVAEVLIRRFNIKSLIFIVEADENRDVSKKDFYLLKLETIYLWRALLGHNLYIDEFIEWLPCLIRLLFFYVEKVDLNTENEFDFELFSALTSLIITCNKHKILSNRNVDEIMKICLEKWLTQLMRFNQYNFATSKALGCLLRYFTSYYKAFGVNAVDLEFIEKTNKLLMSLFESVIFGNMSEALMNYSYVLSPSAVTRDPDNLPSLCTVYDGGDEFLRIVNTSSPLPLFMSLVKYLKESYRISVETRSTIQRLFDCTGLRKYILKVYKCKLKDYNWFIKYEFDFLLGCLYLLVIIENQESVNLSFRLFPMTRVDDSKRASKILQIMCDANIWKLEFGLDFLGAVRDVCMRLLLVEGSETEKLNYKKDLIPEEWPYKLLSLLRGNEEVGTVISVLKFISFVLDINSKLFDRIPHTLRYYYLCTVFLTDCNVFDFTIHGLMEDIFRDILENRTKVNLNMKYEKKKSFYDLFTEVIAQYGAVSYGLQIFGKLVLFALQNRFDVSYRKLLWFEYMDVLRVINIPFPSPDFLSMNEFVDPVETDESLLTAYLNTTASNVVVKNRNGFVYFLAVGNVQRYLKWNNYDRDVLLFLKKKIRSFKNEEWKRDLEAFSLKQNL